MVALWIGLCALLSCAGWLLSALHLLNRSGYLVFFAATVVGLTIWSRQTGVKIIPRINWRKWSKRFRRGFPLAFAIVAALAILGGILHAPTNYDGLSYRTPRVLQWLAAEQWHWVHTDAPRLNVRAAGFEWCMTPLLAFTKTDRLTFLINAVSFLLLPGLVFSLLHRLGVRRRVARHWMWIVPTGYTYLLQAGSIGNDLFGAVFALAAVDYALRARTSGRLGDVWLSLLAAALTTGAKSSNLVVGLPWILAIWPALGLIRHHLARTLAVALVAVTVSVVPTAILNVRYCGEWSGQSLERVPFGGVPVFRLAVNSVGYTVQNFVPPIFPFAGKWNAWIEHNIPPALAKPLSRHFERAAATFQLGEMQTEEAAGLGFGVCVLLVLTLGAVWRCRKSGAVGSNSWQGYQKLVCAGGGLAVLIFMSQSGLAGAVRYLAPFNVLLIAPLLIGAGHLRVVRAAWWRWAAGGVFVLAGLLLVVNQARPLWPAITVLKALGAENSSHQLVKRAWTVYSVYNRRADAFAPARALLPADANPLGFISLDDPETSLWRPFGTRRILHVRRTETGADLRRRGIKYVFVSPMTLRYEWNISLDGWLVQAEGEVIARLDLNLRASRGPEEWTLIKISEKPMPEK